jgi:hypothetical protein
MPFTPTGNNAMLDAIGVTHVSLHSGFPGTGGANEISGGSPAYARGAITFGAAAASERAQGADVTLNVPGGGTNLQYVGYWTALTGGNFRGYHPLGNAPVIEFITDVAGDAIEAPAHGQANSNQIVFVGGAPPAPLVEGTIYFVVGATADTLQVAATSGGAAINLTSQAAQSCQLVRIIPETFGSQGTLRVSGNALRLTL